MSSSLGDRLRAERHRRFVGRTHELELFQSAVSAAELPFYVLHIFGPGGIGKTTLLKEFLRYAEQAQLRTIYLDARNVEPTPDSFLSALRFAMGLPSDSPLQALAAQGERHVLLLDTYEMFVSLDEWLRQEFLPQLPDNTLTVMAGRHSPAVGWRTDLGWQALIHLLPLRNLSPEESRTYLTQRQVPLVQHQTVLDFTHGHALALSLVADVFTQGQEAPHFQPEAMPDVIKALLERFMQEVPTPSHRMALEACALIRLTTEALLAEMLDMPDVHELFEWLRGLSFIEVGLLGLFPHDLAREVIVADLRWRHPDWYIELHRRARNYYTTHLGQTQGQEQHRVLFDYIFLHRDNPAIRPRFTWQENSSLLTDSLQETDKPFLVGMTAKHEGEESAQILVHWLERQPQGVVVLRDAEQEPAGFVFMIALHQASREDFQVDPGARAAWHYLQDKARLREGEGATLFRFWMARDTYQAVSPTQSRIFISFVQHHHTAPGPAFTFYPCAAPDDWAAMFAYADLARIPEADFEVGGRRYGVYGHDWRLLSPKAWQELLARREIAASSQALPTSQASEPLVVLRQPEFARAVIDTLRQFSRPDTLRQNPLLQSRLVVEQVAANASQQVRIATLQALVKEAAESLKSSPREAKCYQALYHTYLQPAPTQERAAEILNLPFSTFRRHLKTGIARVTDILWQREIG
ncbi:MAG: ATP-binding protein [Chroococcidiopsidaceae cyanobacterium CP_BM_ER_R8_30]|nr:ATP-binding protein [Chroococcidiopsidaceae cyanobacterium CP_BM_ER_R8_30]